jgi:hypothetical protein
MKMQFADVASAQFRGDVAPQARAFGRVDNKFTLLGQVGDQRLDHRAVAPLIFVTRLVVLRDQPGVNVRQVFTIADVGAAGTFDVPKYGAERHFVPLTGCRS